MTDTDTTLTPGQQLRADLFSCALEGGVNYWSQCSKYRWDVVPATAYVAVLHYEDENGDAKVTEINDALMARGYRLATTTHRDRIGWSTERPPLVVTADTDWDYDAGDADCILQLGLFGEVIYG